MGIEDCWREYSATNKVKYFPTFRADGYKRYLLTAHTECWKQYQELAVNDHMEDYFKNVSVASATTCSVLLGHAENHSRILINASMRETAV